MAGKQISLTNLETLEIDDAELGRRISAAFAEIGADPIVIAMRNLPVFTDAVELAVAHVSRSGRRHLLIPEAASSWIEMRKRAAADGVELVMISGYRGFSRQLELIQARLAAGEHVDDILRLLAPPGFSEHHTGRAADIGTPGCAPLSESFETTPAFEWLRDGAGSFGFSLSYPRGNRWGYRYEPWHWCYSAVKRPDGLGNPNRMPDGS